jgi:hypothetical protein
VIGMVYGDLSGDEASIVTAGCYLGKQDEWLNAIAAWSIALDDAGVKEFHATDFYNAKRQFDDDKWRREVPGRGMVVGSDLHNAFAERFASIPVDSGLLGFAYSLDVPPFNEILAPELAKAERKHLQRHPRTQAIMSSLASIGAFFEKSGYRENGQIQVIFEHEHGAGKFGDFFNESRDRNERWTYFFQSFTTAPKSLVPLQMADLLAHETWRRTKQVRSDPSAPLRKSFERMLGDGKVSLLHHDRDHCAKNATMIRDLLSRYPNGLVPPEDTKDVP